MKEEKTDLVVENWLLTRSEDPSEELVRIDLQAELATTSKNLDDLRRKAAADSHELRNALNVNLEAENRLNVMDIVESSHWKLLKDTKAEVRSLKTFLGSSDLELDALERSEEYV